MISHLLQTIHWKDFQEYLGLQTVTLPSGKFAFGIIERPHGKLGRFFRRLYIPYGPTVGSGKDLKKVIQEAENVANSLKCDSLRIEPFGVGELDKQMISFGYKKRKKSSQPEVTRILNIGNKTEESIVSSMNATNRNLWHKNVSLGDDGIGFKIVKKSVDAKAFLDMMNETSKRTGAVFHTDDYYKKMIDFFGSRNLGGVMYASDGSKKLAGALFIINPESKTIYYMHAGSVVEARKLNAGNLLVSNLIMYGKSLGMAYVDLFGVCPVDSPDSHPLYGISKFKRAYGGEDVVYNGTWEKGLSAKFMYAQKIIGKSRVA